MDRLENILLINMHRWMGNCIIIIIGRLCAAMNETTACDIMSIIILSICALTEVYDRHSKTQ